MQLVAEQLVECRLGKGDNPPWVYRFRDIRKMQKNKTQAAIALDEYVRNTSGLAGRLPDQAVDMRALFVTGGPDETQYVARRRTTAPTAARDDETSPPGTTTAAKDDETSPPGTTTAAKDDETSPPGTTTAAKDDGTSPPGTTTAAKDDETSPSGMNTAAAAFAAAATPIPCESLLLAPGRTRSSAPGSREEDDDAYIAFEDLLAERWT